MKKYMSCFKTPGSVGTAVAIVATVYIILWVVASTILKSKVLLSILLLCAIIDAIYLFTVTFVQSKAFKCFLTKLRTISRKSDTNGPR